MKNFYTLFLCLFIFTNLSAQEAGDLDPAFGGSGYSIVSFLYGNAMNDISIQADDKIVAGGYYQFSARNLLAFRFKTDGTLDNFNAAAWYEENLGDDEMITATKVLPDGRILLAGYYGAPYSSFMICLDSDGYPCESFGISGVANYSIDFIPEGIDFYENDGFYDYYLCGHSSDYSSPGILMIGPFGMIVNSFGTDGIYSISNHDGSYYDIVVDSDNDFIYVCGSEFLGNDSFVCKHKTTTGALISTFADAGCYSFAVPSGHSSSATTLLFQKVPDVLTIFGDYIHTALDRDLFAIRLSATDGTPDNTFGVGGWSSMRVAGSDEYINDAVAQMGGKYIFGGYTNFNTDNDFLLGRIMNDGYLDPDFGDAGTVITNLTGDDMINGIGLSNDHSRVYAGGVSNAVSPEVMASAVACYYTNDATGINEDAQLEKIKISVFPNPADDMITIETADGNCSVEIIDLSGKTLINQKLNTAQSTIDISLLPAGIYFIRLGDHLNHFSTQKLIKK
jgi:uncharacterized delta-60 repeat protein